MDIPKNYPSRTTVIATLKRLFVEPGKTVLSLEEVYRAAGRDLTNPTLNKRWLNMRLTYWRYYGFVESVFARARGPGRREVNGIRLTPEGEQALESPVPARVRTEPRIASPEITLEFIAQKIRLFKIKNPSVDVDFQVTIRR